MAEAGTELGFVLDKLQRYDEAYRAFEKGQQAFSRLPNAAQIDGRALLKEVAANKACFTRDRIDSWSEVVAGDGFPVPVFLVGFPRSGTTLSEQILAAHPGIQSSDEHPFLPRVLKAVKAAQGRPYPEGLDDLDLEQIGEYRAHYWSQVEKVMGPREDAGIMVDKLPLNIIHLGLVQRLFPEAKILVALRDPRDVSLSCFMQAFRANTAMANFFNMQSTVRAYAAVMDLWMHYRQALRLEYREFQYETLVSDTETTARGLLEFLDLPWDPAVLDHAAKSRGRAIRTPSYQAVVEPVNTARVARWKNYKNQAGPAFASLAPFVKAFGYTD